MAQAVIFDLDGTLADSEPLHERSLLAAAETRGMTFSPEYFRTRCVGVGEAGCFRMLAEEQGVALDDRLLAELIEMKLRLFVGAVGEIEACAGAVELVRAAAASMPVGVCSGSSRGSVEPVLEMLGLGGVMGAVVTSCDVREHKPHPEGYRLTASRLGIAPGACVAIEDSPTGVAAAVAAGMRVVGVEHSYPRDRLVGADLVVAAIGELDLAALRAV